MKTLGFILLGYAIFGCIPVFATEGKLKIALVIIQFLCLIIGSIILIRDLKKSY